MSVGEVVYKNRGFTPVLFIVPAILLANPQKDLAIFGGILMGFGELLRIIAVSYIGASARAREVNTEKLVTNGPYGFLRNPMYLGNMFLYTGASILTAAWLPYLLYLAILFFTIQYAFCIKYEEQELAQVYTEEYHNYKTAVPRYFPRLSPYQGAQNITPDLSQALMSEKSTLLAIAGFLTLVLGKWYLNI
jgi:protein-S-isoprenylcysteine O-methyltransferase Ste14